MINKLLLIGGTSAIGKALLPYLEEDYNVLSVGSHDLSLPKIWDVWDECSMVVNLAAVTTDCELCNRDTTDENLLDVNCLGAVRILNTFLPHMRKRKYGRIIMMSSIYSVVNVAGQGLYSASKAFVDKLVKIAAIENAEYGITVNSIQLGYTGIGIGETTEENKEKALAKIKMGRFVTMQELYNTIDYIIKTEYLTGQNIRLDGGVR